jgi:hypothetical protein
MIVDFYRHLVKMTPPFVHKMKKSSQQQHSHIENSNTKPFDCDNEIVTTPPTPPTPPTTSSSLSSSFSQRHSAPSSHQLLDNYNLCNNYIPNQNDHNILITINSSPNNEKITKTETLPYFKRETPLILNEGDIVVYSHIFVCGDVAAIKAEKYAQYAELEADIVVHNILELENRSDKNPKLRAWITPVHRYTLTSRVHSLIHSFIHSLTLLKPHSQMIEF